MKARISIGELDSITCIFVQCGTVRMFYQFGDSIHTRDYGSLLGHVTDGIRRFSGDTEPIFSNGGVYVGLEGETLLFDNAIGDEQYRKMIFVIGTNL